MDEHVHEAEQEQFECFGIPAHVHVESDGSAARLPPGWGRRNWVLLESPLLGAEAMPSPPMAASVEVDIVR
jgi:hypothetical protein